MCKSNQKVLDSKIVSPDEQRKNPRALDSHKAGIDMMSIVYFAVAVVIIGVVSQIGIYILEKVSDKTALTSTDTFSNASNDSVDAVETGFDFQEILILGVVATVVIGMFLSMLGVNIKL